MTLLEGKPIAKQLSEKLKIIVERLIETTNTTPKLVAVNLGDDSASEWYNRSIEKACGKVGIDYELYTQENKSLKEASELIKELNNDNSVHGILINQPLPKELHGVIEWIAPEKDIEGATAVNLGRLLLQQKTHIPCTPRAVMTIIDEYHIDLTGLKVCMLGRSNIVGKPLSLLLTERNGTVTLCHSKTKVLEKELLSSDVIVVAIGKAHYVKAEWVKNDAVIIDVGTNYTDNGLVGDVDFESVKEKASMITPVPGGVGSLTNVMLLENCIEAFQQQVSMEHSL
ncbi:MAG: bifunctional protein FolD [bacterium]|nr:MAG: bifunctional protein FolD [bacterium]